MTIEKIQARKESLFFLLSGQYESLPRDTPSITRFEQVIHPLKLYAGIDREPVSAQVLETDLGIPGTCMTIMGTPSAEAVAGAGLFKLGNGGNGLQYVFPRFHTGWEAQLDMKAATAELIKAGSLAEQIADSDPSSSGIIQFTREGHLPDLPLVIGMSQGVNLPATVVKISHVPAENSFTREAYVEPSPNLEGFSKHLKRLFIVDPVASGLQQIAMLEKLEEMARLPENLVVIAPMATKYGMEIIAEYCRLKGMNFHGAAFAGLLDIRPPLFYYSPYPRDLNQIANTRLHEFIKAFFGDVVHEFCIRGNWTGSFMGGPDFPLVASEEELEEYGLSNQALFDISRNVTAEQAEAEGVLQDLLPLSTKLSMGKIIFDKTGSIGSYG